MRILLGLILLVSFNANALCVKYNEANLRSGPGSKYKVTWKVSQYTPLLQIDKKGGWYQVRDQDGDEHWVYRSVVSRDMKCAAVKTNKASLRTGPGTNNSLGDIHFADKYTAFKRLDIADNGWYKVQASWGSIYWVHPNLLWRPVRVRGVKFK